MHIRYLQHPTEETHTMCYKYIQALITVHNDISLKKRDEMANFIAHICRRLKDISDILTSFEDWQLGLPLIIRNKYTCHGSEAVMLVIENC